MRKNKIASAVLGLSLAMLLGGCKDRIVVNFTYEPSEPKVGQTVQFTSLADGGETFDWTFQNEATSSVYRSTAQNPSRVFTSPGNYVVTLRVDSNDHFVHSKQLYVYDSIPQIARDKQTVHYYENVKFSTVAYNPYSRDITCQWFFSENARRTDGGVLRDTVITLEDGTQAMFYVAYDAEPEVYFSKMGEDSVRLRMTIGTTEYPTTQIKSDVFQVQDTATRSLLMAREGGKILRQRIFENGVDALETTDIDAGAHPYNLVSVDEELYVFDAGSHVDELTDWEADTSGDGSIRVVDLNTDGVETVITNRGTSAYFGFYNGYADAEGVYWTDRNDYVYRVPHGSRNLTFEWLGTGNQATYPYYVADASVVEGMPTGVASGGIYAYSGTYYWAKDGEGRGLYRFKSQAGTVTTLNNAAILTDYAIRAFVYDRNNNIIYFAGTSANGESGLWKSDLDGLNTQLVDAADLTAGTITGITLDHTAGRVLWAYHNPDDPTASGVKQMNLLRSAVEAPGEVTYFNKEQGILGIALDNVPKLGL